MTVAQLSRLESTTCLLPRHSYRILGLQPNNQTEHHTHDTDPK